MTVEESNPYATPTQLAGENVIPSPGRASPGWLFAAIVLTLFGYLTIMSLLLSSTPTDRYYGYFYIPVAVMLVALAFAVRRAPVLTRFLALATGFAQCLLGLWLTLVHGLETPTLFLAVLPSVVVLGVSLACFVRREVAPVAKSVSDR